MDGAQDLVEKSLYDSDFYAWVQAQADALRARDAAAIDWENVIEEIETLGRSERSRLRSVLETILEHMIKHDYGLNDEPKRGWTRTIQTQRRQAAKVLKDNPSLRPLVGSLIKEEYPDARTSALESFEDHEFERLKHYESAIPQECPYNEQDTLG
jgi:FixJ family two-component response regulator